ncbi:50S ribosomal protein L7/L12 [Candidatus Bipolaricaulota bacterium]|uniref:Ribosomal protein L7/L12 C-terminal domain-containing protein n=1 Tax=marine sediment metagenome TaxID=412755 RepID=X1D463_9ZZZZ|nr:50S ribosomal protein L7/L12 [Candidatus Bipolaricaulota bacterium]MCK4600279.1 50S ribosomal protein L7/L12 [Candidatus Bipolaricaulota bacterium]
MGKAEILQEIENMTVKDLADLVEMIEERFNVSAAMMAPVAVAPAPGEGGGAEGGGAEAETYKVLLTNPGQKKIQVIKEIKEITGKGLKECKELVDNLPATIKEGVGPDEAASLKEKLEAAGAEVELKQ